MNPRSITKRSPIDVNFLKAIGEIMNAVEAYDRRRLTPSKNARRAAKDVARKIIQIVEACPFVGRAVQTGSSVRGTNLKKPGWSDVDLICFLHAAHYGRLISSFVDFEKFRWKASEEVRDHLAKKIGGSFDEAEIAHFERGFVIKLEVKRSSRSLRPWCVDVMFARDLEENNNHPHWSLVQREFDQLPQSKKLTQTHSVAPYRDAFLQRRYVETPRLLVPIRWLKAFNRILDRGDRKYAVYGFFFEMLVVLLFSNGFIPAHFNIPRALATCYAAIASPSQVPALCFEKERAGGDALDRPAPPTKDQLAAMKKQAGANCLVLVDPFAPFNNVAFKKEKQMDAWSVLEKGAADMLEDLKSKNVFPYAF